MSETNVRDERLAAIESQFCNSRFEVVTAPVEIMRWLVTEIRRLEATDCIPKAEVIDLIRAVPNLVADVKRLEADNERQRETIGDLNAFDVPQALVDARLRINELEAERARALELLTTGYYGKAIRALEGKGE